MAWCVEVGVGNTLVWLAVELAECDLVADVLLPGFVLDGCPVVDGEGVGIVVEAGNRQAPAKGMVMVYCK